ncbi:MAG: ABC transporter ATP-binding protein [Betaproteobacteria bacterium]|nr:ABC transporter ATP-binding protein [Betaproteobacteria bacterium]
MAKVTGHADTIAPGTKLSGKTRAVGLRKWYQRPSQPPAHVLEDCSIDIEPGKLTVLMGVSGCGKSTLAYMLAGYVQPDAGTLTIDDRPIEAAGPDRILVFQETALWHWMTVLDNVLFGPLASSSMMQAEAKAKATMLLAKFGVLDFKDKYPGQLSGGMKRRVELAQALINNPKLMILDEPFRGLDVMTRELMQEYYLKLFEESRLTTLFITSDLEEAIFLADRVLVMSGSPARIVKTVDVNLPHPRKFGVLISERYVAIKRELMEALYGQGAVDAILPG